MITKQYQNGLEYIEVTNNNATAKIALQGAHVFHFQAKNKKPLLWLSACSLFEKGKAIRGGIPICWPWFGANETSKKLPNHGFARTALWTHEESSELDEGTTKLIFSLVNTQTSWQLWPYAFKLSLEVIVSDTLTLSLITQNRSLKDFDIAQALHTYFNVDDISNVVVEGLENKKYFNKLDNTFSNVQASSLVFSREVDRIYSDTTNPLYIKDGRSRIVINTKGSSSTIVWNPWEKRMKEMPDLSTYKTMVCVESANVLEDTQRVEAGESLLLKVVYSY